ncbi:MAG: Ca2+/Na+ antiporter [Patiriisocius sp.]|jgi:Ca2+/Na+ antiporter
MIITSLLLIILCCLIIWRASDGFEAASEYLGRNLNEGVRGATINAIGSSMPELFTTLFFLFVLKDKDGFAGGIGTTAGSAIFNGMIIPAMVILIVVLKRVSTYVEVSPKVILRDGISLLIAEFVLIILLGGDTLTWHHGLVLMLVYGVYVAYMLSSMKSNDASDEVEEEEVEEEEEEEGAGSSMLANVLTLNLEPVFVRTNIQSNTAWGLLLTSMLVIGSACLLLVKSCEWLGDDLNMPIYFIAVILASAATSVPDTILSMKDAKKGNYDDAVSNALGSNIFDICFALGFPLFIFTIIYGPIEMTTDTIQNISELRILLFVLTFVAFIIYIFKRKLGKVQAILLLLIYVLFTLYILGRATGNETSESISQILASINDWVDMLRFWK